MKLIVSRRAGHRITEIRDYIAQDNPRAASRVVARIRAAASLLVHQPTMGRLVPGSQAREWPVRGLPYILIYRVQETEGRLVFHGARKR
ncbi:type II toxin-antitoxin system RelE/ParE family toxin [Enterovirga sp.]|uniref:type II toxin-antitoxin system RelE/ParE family toxin n=1 Tax=Enterovirga sp. TaxID=2026350 RepID=UPI002BA67C5D|nr:type II toxin-antitoxin system RelE/ParE family toxin [Enterovirga sp.]HMO30838.1 type II toxin-antitoxin system RelE/ParE family toxin [Enterovirga sp.]